MRLAKVLRLLVCPSFTSSANNMYWNAMVSPEKTGLIDFYDVLENYVGETEGEEEVFEDDRSTCFPWYYVFYAMLTNGKTVKK